MSKQTKIANILFPLICLILLAAVWVRGALQPKETVSLYENRALAELPVLSVETIGDGSYFTALETALCDHSAFREILLQTRTRIDLLLNRPVINTVVPTESGVILPYWDYEAMDEGAVAAAAEQNAEALAELQKRIESYGGTFLYVPVPGQCTYYDDLYPSYLNDRAKEWDLAYSVFSETAEELGLNVLDVRAAWAAEGNPREYMSGEDHHYTYAGGYSVYQMIMERLQELGVPVEETELETVTLENPFLGSRAVRLCGLWENQESFTYGYPTEHISFTRYDWGNETPGAETVLSLPAENEPVRYTAYMGTDVSETILQTHREELPDGLIFGDSFTNLQETLLYAAFDEMRSLDLRYFKESSLWAYVEEYQPSVVLCIYDERVYSESGSMDNLFSDD